jgi:hypothetical protein
MCVGVDQARQHRGAAQIDDASARRHLNLAAGAHFGDAVTSNDDDLIRHHAATGTVKQLSGADSDSLACGRPYLLRR